MAAQMSFDEFRVDLGQLHEAIGSVTREHGTISDTMASIASEFNQVKDAWQTPSEGSFDTVQKWLTSVSGDLENILQDAIGRMQSAYDNYHKTEETNVHNNTPNNAH
jgi:uncharacterized protein YukE